MLCFCIAKKAGVGRTEEIHLHRQFAQSFTGVIVGDKDFGVFAAAVIPLGKVAQAADRLDLKVMVELTDECAVVIAHQPFPLAGSERVPQTVMVLEAKRHGVMTFRLVIRRVAIIEGVIPLVLPDEGLKVFVLYNRVAEPPAAFPQQMEGLADIEGLAAVAGAAAAVAQADEFVKGRGPLDVIHRCVFEQDRLDFLILRRSQVTLGDLQFLFQVRAGEFLFFEVPFEDAEFVPPVKGQKVQFLQKRERAVADAAKKVDKIGIEVVIHLHSGVGPSSEQHPAAPAEHLDISSYLNRHPLVDLVAQGFLPADPADDAVHLRRLLPSRRFISSSSVRMQVPSVFQQMKPIPGYGQPLQRDSSLGSGRVTGFGGPADPVPGFSFVF